MPTINLKLFFKKLLSKISTVSLETVQIVQGLPEQFE